MINSWVCFVFCITSTFEEQSEENKMLDTSAIRNNLTLTVGVIFGGITTILLIRKGAQLYSKITQRKALEQSNTKCHVCNSHINLDSSSDFVACGSCNHSPICRNLHCAVWSDKLKAWNCKDCRSFSNGSNSACDWLISQLNEKLLQEKGSQKQIIWDASSTNDNGPLIPLEQREKVREFVEELVSTLIGGSIENAPVGQLSEDKECLPTGENETDSIDESHATLKHLVERIIEEVFKFPDFFDRSGVSSQPQAINLPQFDPKKYEELLATAVLNKLVESYSYERRLDNSSGVHSGSDIENNVQSTLEKSRFENSSTSSSNEPRSDSSNSVSLNDQPMSLTATKYIDILSAENSISSQIDSPTRSVDSDEEAYLSDYIQKHQVPLPGIEAHESDSFDEDCETVNSSVTEGNWQENWLFKKRKLKNETAAAIGMLVPSPMEDVKALIGDKTTDEVSDLSEAGSDLEDDEIETLNGRRSADLPHALIDSKTIIGGKNEFGSFTEVKTIDELLQPDSLVSTQSFDSQNPVIMEAKNDLILINEHDTKPIVLQVHEKLNLNNNNNNYDDNNKVSDKDFIQDTPQNTITNQCSEPTAASNVESIFATENGEPPVPTPRKKSKSFDLAKQVTSVEVSTRPIVENNNLSDSKTVVSPIGVDWNVKSEVDELLASKAQPESLDDELLDLSINDIYDSIEGESTIDYQSLVVEDEKIDNEIRAELPSHHLTSEVSNQLSKLVEDGSNEAGSQKLFEESPLTVPSSNISNENYICKVVPNEFDLSVDSVLELKSNVSEVVVPNGIEDRSVSQLVCISGDSELFPTEILSIENSATEVVIENIINSEQSTIPKLIISNICCDTPPPVVEDDDLASLKPKKTLKAQDSLELPKDDRGKFEPTKRVESFDIEDDDKNMTAKISAFGNVVHSISEHVKNDRETSEHVTVDCEKDSVESFVFVTDEEVTVLKLEEQDSLTQSETFIQNENSESEQSLTSELKTLIETQETTNLNVKLDRPQKIQKTKSLLDDEVGDAEETQRTYTSTLEISPQPDLTTPIAVNVSNAVDSSTKSKDSLLSLPPIEESSTQVDTISRPSTLYSTSNLFSTSQAIILDKSTNIEQLNEGPLPGSIAEREHLKWMNAQDIPNNPYSPEALQRRLSQTKSPSKVIDIGLSLASKPNEDLSPKTDIESGKPIQIVLGAGEPDHMRYGRDYYINDSKSASGTRKKTPSVQRYSSTDDDNISSKATTPDADVYTAKIVQIRDDSDHTKDDSFKLKLSLFDRVSDNSSLSQQSDSLTLSDDSETRVYDLRKNETVYLRSDIIRTSRIPDGATVTPPPTPIDGESSHNNLDQFFAIQQLNQLKKTEDEQESVSQVKVSEPNKGVSKPLSPETLKFFSSKPKPVFNSKFKMEEVVPVKSLILEREEKVVPQNGSTIEKAVIEEDVISSLPSVKALAKNFIEPTNEAIKTPLQRPRSFTWQVSNENTKTNGHLKEPSPDSYVPMYESRYHPVAPGHSITARSLSTKFREELRHSISDDASNSTDNIEIVERERNDSDRPPSPVLLKGIFKEKMSFFQNLEK